MNLFNRIRDALFGTPPPTLRNKPGGMAWIKPFGQDMGAGVLAGRVVKTVRLNEHGSWDIEPAQTIICTAWVYFPHIDCYGFPGAQVTYEGLNDEILEPIGNPGYTEKDESLRYLPPVPTSTKVPKGIPA